MKEEKLRAHSVAEAYLYIMATPCPSCLAGPLEITNARHVEEDEQSNTLRLTTTCAACCAGAEFTFDLPGGHTLETDQSGSDDRATAIVNPSDRPSEILDVGQWLVLFRVITETAARETDKVEARYLGLEAAQCLEEALKFFTDEESDLPPLDAILVDTTRELLRKHPEKLSRQRLLALRSKLPSNSALRATFTRARARRWRRRGP